MLPFFRKIRYKLANDNQFLKYSRYAIGEIVLVVIGILIALYINNWNEERKQREKFDQILVEVEKELISNIEICRGVIDDLFIKDSLIGKILFDTLTYDDYNSNTFLYSPIKDRFPPSISSNAFNNLIQVNATLTPEQDSIKSSLTQLFPIRDILLSKNSELNELEKNVKESYKNYSWYADWRLFIKNEERFNYVLKDPNFRSDVIDYAGILLEDFRYVLERFEMNSLNIYKNVFAYIEKKKISHSDSLYFQYDPQNFEHYVGTYIHRWQSFERPWPTDSLVLSIERDKLLFIAYYSEGTIEKREIIPVSKNRFRTDAASGFYRFIIDENNDVTGYLHSSGLSRDIKQKIR